MPPAKTLVTNSGSIVERLVLAGTVLFFAIYWWVYGVALTGNHLVDAKSFWLGAHMAFIEAASPYPNDSFVAAAAVTPGGYAHPFVYPPPSLLLFSPLSPLGYRTAAVALLFVSHAALMLALLGMSKAVYGQLIPHSRRDRVMFAIIAILLAIMQASRITHGLAQVNFVALAGLTWFWAAVKGEANPWVGAMSLVCIALLKPYFAVVGVVLLLPAARRMLAPTIVLSCAFLLLSVLVLPAQYWADWGRHYLFPMADTDLYLGKYPYIQFDNKALTGALGMAPFIANPDAVKWWLLAIALFLQAAALTRAGRNALALTSAVMAMLPLAYLAAPFSHSHYQTYCGFAAAIVSLAAIRHGAYALLVVAIALLFLFVQPSAIPGPPLLNAYVTTLAVAAFWGACIATALTAPRWPSRAVPTGA